MLVLFYFIKMHDISHLYMPFLYECCHDRTRGITRPCSWNDIYFSLEIAAEFIIKDANTCKENQKLTHKASDGLPGKNVSFSPFLYWSVSRRRVAMPYRDLCTPIPLILTVPWVAVIISMLQVGNWDVQTECTRSGRCCWRLDFNCGLLALPSSPALPEGRSVCMQKRKGPREEVSTMPKLGGSFSLSFVWGWCKRNCSLKG